MKRNKMKGYMEDIKEVDGACREYCSTAYTSLMFPKHQGNFSCNLFFRYHRVNLQFDYWACSSAHNLHENTTVLQEEMPQIYHQWFRFCLAF